jgi:hypothetical protein
VGLPRELTTRRNEHHGSRLGDLIRRLGSTSDGEKLATVYAILRVLESGSADVHGFAEHVENLNGSGITEAELTKVYNAGYAQGVQDTPRTNSTASTTSATRTANRIGTASRYSCSETSIAST